MFQSKALNLEMLDLPNINLPGKDTQNKIQAILKIPSKAKLLRQAPYKPKFTCHGHTL